MARNMALLMGSLLKALALRGFACALLFLQKVKHYAGIIRMLLYQREALLLSRLGDGEGEYPSDFFIETDSAKTTGVGRNPLPLV